MKKFLTIITLLALTLFTACCDVNAQSSEFTFEGKTIEIYKWNGEKYQYSEKSRMDISLYFNWGAETPVFMLNVNKSPDNVGVLGATEYYTKKDKLIKNDDVDKMKAKGKLDHYILNSIQTLDNSVYKFYVPHSILDNGGGTISFMKTTNNQSTMYKFKVQDWYNGKPEMSNSLEEFK